MRVAVAQIEPRLGEKDRTSSAGGTEEALVATEIDLEQARDKDYLFGDRRPELYGVLVEERETART